MTAMLQLDIDTSLAKESLRQLEKEIQALSGKVLTSAAGQSVKVQIDQKSFGRELDELKQMMKTAVVGFGSALNDFSEKLLGMGRSARGAGRDFAQGFTEPARQGLQTLSQELEAVEHKAARARAAVRQTARIDGYSLSYQYPSIGADMIKQYVAAGQLLSEFDTRGKDSARALNEERNRDRAAQLTRDRAWDALERERERQRTAEIELAYAQQERAERERTEAARRNLEQLYAAQQQAVRREKVLLDQQTKNEIEAYSAQVDAARRATAEMARLQQGRAELLRQAQARQFGAGLQGESSLRGTLYGVGSKDLQSLAEMRGYYQALEKATNQTRRLGDESRRLTDEQALLHSATRGVSGALGGLWLTYGRYVPAMIAGFAAMSTLKGSIQKGIEFDYTTSFTAALSDRARDEGLAAYKEKLQADIREVAKTTHFSANELAKGLRVMEQTGIDAANGVKLIATAAQAAVMGEVDLKTATEDLVGVLEVFKLRSNDPLVLQKNFQRVGDVMATVAKETKANLHDVAQSLQGVVGVAGAYQVRLETVASIVTQLGKAGIVGEKAGTFTRNMIENLYSTNTEKAVQIRKELGLTPFDANGNLKRDVDYLLEAMGKLRTLNPKEQVVAIQDLFNERGAKPARELMLAFEGIAASISKMDNSKGTLAEFARSLEGVAKIEWQTVAARWDDLLAGAFKGSEQTLVDLAKQLQRALNDPAVMDGLRSLISLTTEFAKWTFKALEGWGLIFGLISQEALERSLNRLQNARADAEKVLAGKSRIALGVSQEDAKKAAREALDAIVKEIENHPLTKRRREERAAQVVDLMTAKGFLIDLGREGRRMTNEEMKNQAGVQYSDKMSRLSRETMDPERYREDKNAYKAQIDSLRRRYDDTSRLTDTFYRSQQRLAQERQKAGLISQAQYENEIEDLTRRQLERRLRDQETYDEELARRAKSGYLSKPDRERIEAERRHSAEKLEQLRVELGLERQLAQIRGEGKLKKIESDAQRRIAEQDAVVQEQIRKRREEAIAALLPEREAEALRARREAEFGYAKMIADATEALKQQQVLYDKTVADLAAAQADESGLLLGEVDRLLQIKLDADATLERYRQVLQELNAAKGAAGDEAERSAKEVYDENMTGTEGLRRAWKVYTRDAANDAKWMGEAATNVFQSMESAWEKFTTTGKLSFKDLVRSVLADLAKLTAQRAFRQLLNIGLNVLLNGASSDSTGSEYATAGTEWGWAVHTGGVAGLEGSARRLIPSTLLVDAPRYHRGGLAGDEVPAILQRGEGVFTPEQMKRLAPVGSGETNVQINIEVNNNGASAETKVDDKKSAELGRMVESAVMGIIVREKRPGGLLAA